MKRIVFFRGLCGIAVYTSACPSRQVDTCQNVSVPEKATADTKEAFPCAVRLVAVATRGTRDTRPRRPLLPNENPGFLSDLPATFPKMDTWPTPDRAGGLKVAKRLEGFENQRFAGSSRQRDDFSGFSIQQLFDCRPSRTLLVSLPLLCRSLLTRTGHCRAQRLGFVAIRPGHADIDSHITSDHIRRRHGGQLWKLDKDTGHHPAMLALLDFTSRPQLPATPERIVQGAMGLGGNLRTGGRLHPVRIRRALLVRFDTAFTQQGKISRAVKRGVRGLLSGKACIDDAPCALLGLVRNPAESRCTLRDQFLNWPLVVILGAVVQHIRPIPVLGIADMFRLARIRQQLQLVAPGNFGWATRHLFLFGNVPLGRFALGADTDIDLPRCPDIPTPQAGQRVWQFNFHTLKFTYK